MEPDDPTQWRRFIGVQWAWTYSGLLSLVLGLLATAGVAWLVYDRQRREQEALTDLVESVNSAVADVAEMLAARQQQEIAEDIDETGDDEPNKASGDLPANEAVYTDALKQRGINLDANARWMKKSRHEGDKRGNLGWFVDVGDGRRYFVHHGRKTIVRQAIPRDLLDEWKKVTGKDSTEIELDYQAGSGRGNHAWFIRTYAGDRWRITRGNGSIVVTQLEGDSH